MDNSNDLNIEFLSIEMQLLIVLISSVPNDQAKLKHLFQQVNWDAFIALARHHRVYPYLYSMIKEMGDEGVPSHVIQRFSRNYRKNTFQMLQLRGEMDIISRKFAQHGIRLLYLKGPVIAEDLYGDISLRTSCDLDLIVPLPELDKAEAQIVSLGYVKDEYIQTILNDWKWRHHHITFLHPDKGIKVEIHWRLNPAPSKEPDFEELWSRRRNSSMTSHPAYYLGREDLFLFLVSHGARHGWSRLRWLQDIQKLMEQHPDPNLLLSLLRENLYLHTGGQALVLASQLLKTSIQKEFEFMLSDKKSLRLAKEVMFYVERIVNLHTPPVPEEVEKYHKRHMFSLLSKRQKLQFIMSFLFPYPEDAETMPLPKQLHFLYFPLRPFLWVWRKTVGVIK